MFHHAMREVELTKRYGDLPTIECHAGELIQVWTNLVSNALHAMDEKGELRVETDVLDAENVRVRITDSGPGISAENLARVFEPNFTTKDGRVSFGLGIGLAICYEIVVRHGGTIEMASKPGCTCVTVVLPLQYQGLPD